MGAAACLQRWHPLLLRRIVHPLEPRSVLDSLLLRKMLVQLLLPMRNVQLLVLCMPVPRGGALPKAAMHNLHGNAHLLGHGTRSALLLTLWQ